MIPRYQPMLATPWPQPFSDDGWFFEPKWDGYRLIIRFDGGHTSLWTRQGNDVTDRYPELSRVGFDRPVVFDGEVVVLDEDGRASFERLQQRSGRFSPETASSHPVTCVVFDQLFDGQSSLIETALTDRLKILAASELPEGFIVGSGVRGAGLDLWTTVVADDLEGMVAKRLSGYYRPGVRSPDWRKIHHVNTAKAVVGGFTVGQGARTRTFGGLLLGQWDGEALRWVGSVGTGFSDTALGAIRRALDEQMSEACPFHSDPGLPASARYVEPSLVVKAGYRNWTAAGRLRHPRFLGFTDDPVESITFGSEGPPPA